MLANPWPTNQRMSETVLDLIALPQEEIQPSWY